MKTIEVVAAIIRKGDKIFATQRGYGEWKDWWEFPGGKMEPGETPEEALLREIREELDTEIRIDKFLHTVEWDYPDFHLTMHCFMSSLLNDALHLNEHEAARWLGVSDLATVNWLPADISLLPLIKNELESMIKLIIFDFDGTLADTRELIVRTNQEAQRIMGYPITDEAGILKTIGHPLRECILTMYPDLPPEALPLWVKTYREVFDVFKTQIVPQLFPNVKKTLASLAGNGYKLTVASSRGTGSLTDFLREMGIAPYITYVLGADDVKLAKPHPEPVLKTLEAMSCDASEALVVGDMPVDIQMGLSAGAWTCGVTYGNSDREALLAAGAHHVISDFSELESLL